MVELNHGSSLSKPVLLECLTEKESHKLLNRTKNKIKTRLVKGQMNGYLARVCEYSNIWRMAQSASVQVQRVCIVQRKKWSHKTIKNTVCLIVRTYILSFLIDVLHDLQITKFNAEEETTMGTGRGYPGGPKFENWWREIDSLWQKNCKQPFIVMAQLSPKKERKKERKKEKSSI